MKKDVYYGTYSASIEVHPDEDTITCEFDLHFSDIRSMFATIADGPLSIDDEGMLVFRGIQYDIVTEDQLNNEIHIIIESAYHELDLREMRLGYKNIPMVLVRENIAFI